MTRKINTAGLDELVALGVTVVITEDVVFLQVAEDNDAGKRAASKYVGSDAIPPDGSDGWIPAETVTVRRPGGLNVARDWPRFTDYLHGRSHAAFSRDVIILNHYKEDRDKARDLYNKLKDMVKIEIHEYNSYDFAALTREFDKIPVNQTVSVTKDLNGQLAVATPGADAAGDED